MLSEAKHLVFQDYEDEIPRLCLGMTLRIQFPKQTTIAWQVGVLQ
jgi:hypothetical protein